MAIKIVSRSAWGAGPPHGSFQPVNWNRPDLRLYVHHTDGATDQPIREIQLFHQSKPPKGRGWTDIGYHFLVREDGTIYEGRPEGVRGAHDGASGANEHPGVALIGDYSTRKPTEAQHRAVYEIKAHVGAVKLMGHRDDYPTSCPGDAAYKMIVQGPPPAPPVRYYFERIVDGRSVMTWTKSGYAKRLARDLHYVRVKCAHPKWALRKFAK